MFSKNVTELTGALDFARTAEDDGKLSKDAPPLHTKVQQWLRTGLSRTKVCQDLGFMIEVSDGWEMVL